MPSPRELPSDLKDLPDIKGIEIRRGKLDEDCRDLIGRILQLLPRSYKIKYRIKRIGYSVSFAIIIILAALGAALAILVLFASGLL
jgi:hypothetical protein